MGAALPVVVIFLATPIRETILIPLRIAAQQIAAMQIVGGGKTN